MTIGITFCIIAIANYVRPDSQDDPAAGRASRAPPISASARRRAPDLRDRPASPLPEPSGLPSRNRLRGQAPPPPSTMRRWRRHSECARRRLCREFRRGRGACAFGGVVARTAAGRAYYALRYMVTFLVVVSVGGAGSIPGALAACLLLGGIDTTGRYLDAGIRRVLLLSRRHRHRLRVSARPCREMK